MEGAHTAGQQRSRDHVLRLEGDDVLLIFSL